MDPTDALRALYGEGPIDMTNDGWQRACDDLRRQDRRLAERAERGLDPYLRARVFPRRQIGWEHTSEGLRARLALMQANPHIHIDVTAIRAALAIDPADLHVAADDERLWSACSLLDDIELARRAAAMHVAGLWHSVHCGTAAGPRDLSAYEQDLGTTAFRAAVMSANMDLSATSGPRWLAEAQAQEGAPLDRAVAALLERHQLPPVLALRTRLRFYVLSGDTAHLAHPGFAGVLMQMGSQGVGDGSVADAFSIGVGGLDEYVTRKDWDWVWENVIKPRQERLREQRGSHPHGRFGAEVGPLLEAMPIYRAIVLQDLPIAAAIDAAEQDGCAYARTVEARTATRQVRAIDRLLRPISSPELPAPAKATGSIF